jgi:hypothetical protein
MAMLAVMPRLMGPGICGGDDMVELEAVRLDRGRHIEIKPAPLLRCEMAEQFALWLRDDVATRVAKSGMTLARVETYDDYSCRGRNRVKGAKVSEHGKGNAVDVRGLVFADKKTAMLTDKTFAKDIRADLHDSACARFTTVLGPGSDGYHEEHIHVDLAARHNGYRICQWNVLEPPPPPPPPKPAEVANTEEAKPADKADAAPDDSDDAAAEKAAESQPAKPEPAKSEQTKSEQTKSEMAKSEPAKSKAAKPPRVEIALVDVPLPRPRPRPRLVKHRKVHHGVHFPFNLLR